ncbi:MAG: hypothetical protein HY401_00940 [Elusimicrobia bacterium]|nr:hypothetical protein [Elusimicrobiota bacterium]
MKIQTLGIALLLGMVMSNPVLATRRIIRRPDWPIAGRLIQITFDGKAPKGAEGLRLALPHGIYAHLNRFLENPRPVNSNGPFTISIPVVVINRSGTRTPRIYPANPDVSLQGIRHDFFWKIREKTDQTYPAGSPAFFSLGPKTRSPTIRYVLVPTNPHAKEKLLSGIKVNVSLFFWVGRRALGRAVLPATRLVVSS